MKKIKYLKSPAYIHMGLTIEAGERVEVVEGHSADSLVSHPDCTGFFMWNDSLTDEKPTTQEKKQ